MELERFGILVLSGFFHASYSFYHRQYHLINDSQTWPEAQTYCREKHTDLATIYDWSDLMELSSLVDSGDQYVFAGLYRSWGWSLSDADDYKEGEPAYWNWASGEPVINFCGSTGTTGEWFATDCSFNLNFFCYNGFVTDVSGRFSLGNGSMNWSAAQVYCRNLYTDLARVRNQLENQQLQRMVVNGPAWIGLTGLSWMWSDGSETFFLPWISPQPQVAGIAECGIFEFMDSNFLGIMNVDCERKLPFFCYTAPTWRHIITLTLSAVDSSVDMKSPAVTQSILKQMEDRLKEKGATVKLSWRNTEEVQLEKAETDC